MGDPPREVRIDFITGNCLAKSQNGWVSVCKDMKTRITSTARYSQSGFRGHFSFTTPYLFDLYVAQRKTSPSQFKTCSSLCFFSLGRQKSKIADSEGSCMELP